MDLIKAYAICMYMEISDDDAVIYDSSDVNDMIRQN